MFESKDKDLDGRLSFEEFMGEASRAEKLFKLMDKDGDGYVTKHVSVGICVDHFYSWMNDWPLTDQCASFLMVSGQHIIIIHHPLLNISHPM